MPLQTFEDFLDKKLDKKGDITLPTDGAEKIDDTQEKKEPDEKIDTDKILTLADFIDKDK